MTMIGAEISHFKIESRVGAGGMGEVYRAHDLKLRRQVALKILPEGYLASPKAKERFLREARTVATLNHPNIITVHEVDSIDGIDFIAMELVKGQDLKQIIGKEGLDLDCVIKYGIQICDALSYAHGHGVVHRDLKPHNIMITESDDIKVLDFGLAKQFDAADNDSDTPTVSVAQALTVEGTVLGTPRYMSPEQAQGESVDARSDIFSMGTVLYEMLTGKCPFQGKNLVQELTSVLKDRPVPLRSVRENLPVDLERIVAKTMEKDVENRYQNVHDLRSDLKSLHLNLGYTTGTATAQFNPRKLRPRTLVFSGTVFLAIIALGWIWQSRRTAYNQTDLEFQLVSDSSGSHSAASFSPDGNMIAFVKEDEKGVPQIWVKNLSGGQSVQLSFGDVPAGRPRWSPENNQIVFHRYRMGIWSIPPLGGSERQLVADGKNPNFSADGTQLVYESQSKIWLANADGSQPHAIDGVSSGYFTPIVEFTPSFSPNGDEIVYFHPGEGPMGDLWIISARGGTPRQLTSDTSFGGSPIWRPGHTGIVFSSNRSGSLNLWQISPKGNSLRPLTTGAGEDLQPDLTADGRKVIYTNMRNFHVLLNSDPAMGTQTEILKIRSAIGLPNLSPSGDRIVYFAQTQKEIHLFTVGVDGSNPRQLTYHRGGHCYVPQWSSDGEFIYYYQAKPEFSYRKIPADGGESIEVVAGWMWTAQNYARIDPTQNRVVYTLMNPTGRIESTIIRDLDTGTEHQLPQPITHADWSPDGTHIVGESATMPNTDVLVYSVPEDRVKKIVAGNKPKWSPSGDKIYFCRSLGLPEKPKFDLWDILSFELWTVSMTDGRETKICQLSSIKLLTFSYAIMPNGDIIWNQYRPGQKELWMAEKR